MPVWIIKDEEDKIIDVLVTPFPSRLSYAGKVSAFIYRQYYYKDVLRFDFRDKTYGYIKNSILNSSEFSMQRWQRDRRSRRRYKKRLKWSKNGYLYVTNSKRLFRLSSSVRIYRDRKVLEKIAREKNSGVVKSNEI